ncbi:hypothetical protein [Teredinibacter turnerae]|uniref:hypothetical protein n=1 Tax=Teredinibacter turnerae TaxID=2426 RepID=UPI0005F768AD|nr:hypothetical protein [Teredinibacter turnerae]
MGFFDKKTTKNTTNVDNTFTAVDNRYFEDAGYVEGNISISGDGNQITNMRTDFGAIEAARDSAALAFDSVVQLNRSTNDTVESVNFESLDFASGVVRDTNDLAQTSTELAIDAAQDYAARSFDSLVKGQDFARDLNSDSLSFAKSALGIVDGANSEALSFAGDSMAYAERAGRDSLDFAGMTFSDALNAIERDASASRQQTANEISKAYDLAATHSRSEGGEAMDKAVKVLGFGGLGLGLLFIGSQLIKKGK